MCSQKKRKLIINIVNLIGFLIFSVRIQLMFKTYLSYLSQILNWWPQNNKIFLSFKSQSLCKFQPIRHYKLSTSILILYYNFNILKYLKKYISRTNNK